MARYEGLVEAITRLKKALVPGATQNEIIEAMMALAQAGKQLSRSDARKVFRQLFRELAPSTATGDLKFAMKALQDVYEAEVRDKMTSFANAFDWFIHSESKLVVELRQLFTGLNLEDMRFFLHLSDNRLLSADAIIRNDYLPEIADAFLAAVSDPRHGLVEFLDDFVDRGVIERFQETGMIGEESFWRIKGKIMEILCESIKREQFLAEVLRTNPNAEIFEGVMAMTRMTREGTVSASVVPRQIWDGIIAEIKGSKLIIYHRFEIKSGLHGFQHGYDQILATIYHRFVSPGDKLIIKLKNGATRTFVNDSKAANAIEFKSRETILLTPEGVSSHMPDQQFVAGMGDIKISYHWLQIGGREVHADDIEALVMDFLKGFKP